MGQVLHGSATTTHAVRAAIQRSQASIQELSERYGALTRSRQQRRRRFVARHPLGPAFAPPIAVGEDFPIVVAPTRSGRVSESRAKAAGIHLAANRARQAL